MEQMGPQKHKVKLLCQLQADRPLLPSQHQPLGCPSPLLPWAHPTGLSLQGGAVQTHPGAQDLRSCWHHPHPRAGGQAKAGRGQLACPCPGPSITPGRTAGLGGSKAGGGVLRYSVHAGCRGGSGVRVCWSERWAGLSPSAVLSPAAVVPAVVPGAPRPGRPHCSGTD